MSYPPMFVSDKRLDSRSPGTHFQEQTSKQPQPLFQKRNIFPSRPSQRPQSAKTQQNLQSKPQKRKGTRPITAQKNVFINRRLKATPHKEIEGSFLARLKPRHIPMDKQRLYQENIALKFQNNTIKEDMVRLRTRVNQLQREVMRKTDQLDQLKQPGEKVPASAIRKIHIVSSLKNTVRELRQDLKVKQSEISELRKNIKSSRIQELDVEINAYIDQCSRLRHHLEELMRQKDPSDTAQNFNIEEKSYQQTMIIKNLRKESNELSAALEKSREETQKWKQRFLEADKKKKPGIKRNQNGQLKAEIQKLRAQLENNLRESVEQKNQIKEQNQQLISELKEQNQKLISKLKEQNMKLISELKETKRNYQNLEQQNKFRDQEIASLKEAALVLKQAAIPIQQVKKKSSSRYSSSKSLSTQQKMSLLESPDQNLLEYSQDSPAKPPKFSSPPISENSPFQSVSANQIMKFTQEKPTEGPIKVVQEISDTYIEQFQSEQENFNVLETVNENTPTLKEIQRQQIDSSYSSDSGQEQGALLDNIPIVKSIRVKQENKEQDMQVALEQVEKVQSEIQSKHQSPISPLSKSSSSQQHKQPTFSNEKPKQKSPSSPDFKSVSSSRSFEQKPDQQDSNYSSQPQDNPEIPDKIEAEINKEPFSEHSSKVYSSDSSVSSSPKQIPVFNQKLPSSPSSTPKSKPLSSPSSSSKRYLSSPQESPKVSGSSVGFKKSSSEDREYNDEFEADSSSSSISFQ